MSDKVCKVLFLTVSDAEGDNATESFARRIASHLPEGEADHEFLDVAPGQYDSILDRLEDGVLPVVLKPARRQGSGD